MFFEQDYVAFELVDVLYMDQACRKLHNAGRSYDAISFRFSSDTVLETATRQISLGDNAICYIPKNLDYTRISRKDKLIVVHFNALRYTGNAIEYFVPENAEKYSVLFREMLQCKENKRVGYKNECAAIFSHILAEMYKDNQPNVLDSKISKTVNYIEKNCLKPDFSLSYAAGLSFISEPYFRRLFREKFGVSPKQYVIMRRMEYAKELILTGEFTLSEIANLCGYNDYKYFSSEFKKLTGVSPSRFYLESDEKKGL